jgi:hypothetical protein
MLRAIASDRILRKRHLLSAACLVAACLPAAATAADGAKEKAKDEDRQVCRNLTNTGTRIASKECHARSEWVEIDAVRRKQLEQFNRNMNSGAAAERGVSNSPIPR